MDARALVDQLGQHVEVGLDQRRELAPALDLGDDLVLGADRLQHARVGREAGLAAALARQAELLEQDLAELLRRADHELLAGQREDLAFERRDLLAHALGDLRQAVDVQAHAEQLHLAQHGHERQLDLRHHALQPALGDLLALPVGQRAQQHRVGGERVLEVAGQAALLAQLLERVAAPGRLEQVGAEQRVVDEARRDRAPSAFASWATTGRAPQAATTSSGPRSRPRAPRRRRPTAKRHGGALGEQLALGRLAGARRRRAARRSAAPRRAMSAGRARAHARASA